MPDFIVQHPVISVIFTFVALGVIEELYELRLYKRSKKK